MKQVIISVLVILAINACNQSAAPEKTNDESLAVVKKYMQAVETNNISIMDSLLDESYQGYGPSVGDSVTKAEAIQNWKYNTENLYESIKYTRYQNIGLTVKPGEEAEAGDWVSNWAYMTIKYKDGRGPVNAWMNAVYRVKDGKIVHSRTFYNEADVLRQLGYSISKATE